MPKSRRNQLDPELLKKFEDLERRSRETSKRIAVELHRAEEFRRYLREKYRLDA